MGAAQQPGTPAAVDRAAFALLVALQDRGAAVEASRLAVRKKYRFDAEEMQSVEERGLAEDWPPLAEG